MPFLLLSSTAFLHTPALHAGLSAAQAPASIESWAAAVNRRLDQVITAPPAVDGMASATFRRGEDGKITDVRVLATDRGLAEAVRRTLARLERLPPMPIGVDPRQAVRVDLLFGSRDEDGSFLERRQAMLAAAERSNRRLTRRLADRTLTLSAGR